MKTFEQLTDEIFPPGSKERIHLDRHMDISVRTDKYLDAVLGWLYHIPLVGRLAYVCWFSMFEHDMQHYVAFHPKQAIHKWGSVSFGFLNDGLKPSLWHTWIELINHPRYRGIYPDGAPRNRAEAERVIARERWDEAEAS